MQEKKIEWEPRPDFVKWNRLRTIRKARKLRQIDLCVAADISSGTLFYLENGFDNRTSEEIKNRIAKVLEVPVSEIFPAMIQGMVIISTGEKLKAAKPKKKDR